MSVADGGAADAGGAQQGVARVQRAKTARRQEEILRAATLILNRDGVKGMTLASVAASLNTQTPNIAYYFRKKDDLAAACLMRGVERLNGLIAEASAPPTAEGRFRRFIALYFGLLQRVATGDDPPLALLDDTMALQGDKGAAVQSALNDGFRAFRNLLKAPDADHLTWRDRAARARLAINVVTWAPAWVFWHDPEDYPRLGERLADILLGGLITPGQGEPPLRPPAGQAEAASGQPSREAFLIAAIRLINQRGFRGARVDEIAAQLNVTRGSFYHHIDAKEDLVIACFRRTFETVRQAQRAAIDGPGRGMDKLAAACAALVDFQLSSHGPLLRTTALSALSAQDHVDMVMESRRVAMRFAAILSDGILDGSIRPVDVEAASQAVTAALNATPDLLFGLADLSTAEALRIYIRPLLVGLLAA